MAFLHNAHYGRSTNIILPPEYSSKSRLNDYCSKVRNDTNTLAWMERQSKTIADAFRAPRQLHFSNSPTLSVDRCGENAITNAVIKGTVMHGSLVRDQDPILSYTNLTDSESEELDIIPPYEASHTNRPVTLTHNNQLSENVVSEVNKSDAMVIKAEDNRVDFLQGIAQQAEFLIEGEQERDQTWQINNQGHHIVSKSLSTQLTGIKPDSLNPTTDEAPLSLQLAAVEKLVAQNRQLEAFQQALRFALSDALLHRRGVSFTAEVGLRDYALGMAYPTIEIALEEWREDTELQCHLAYYLLRGMLKRYGVLPFPDRVDFRESEAERGRLLVPYNDGLGEIHGEGERVRRRIVDEMRVNGGSSVTGAKCL
ncbi:hypothetical protein F5Y01DRAFT_325617 [Xylaria sp. FL0043]|nr:hypothetical protein F5Y01DRAFT_325617 [Xylaria sp. FL0043]